MSVSLRSRAPASATLRQPPRKVSEPETQVLPFQFDDGTDDNEEIRRRRYSSSCSSSSESDVITRKGLRGGHRRDGRRPHASSHHEKESDWERVSNGVEHSCVSESDDEEPSKAAEPESPRRIVSRKKTQQSESESEGGREEGDEMRKASSGSSTATTLTRASTPTSSPSTPRTLSPEDLAGLSKLAVFPGSEAQLVQGYVRRAKTLLHSQYHFYINDKLVLMAEKQPKSRTPNYYLFDMTRAASGLSTKLSKKSGNYIGKVRSSFNKKKSVLIGNQSRKTELGAIIFSGNVSSSEPRRVAVVLPPLNNKRQEIDGLAVGDEPDIFSILVEHYKALKKDKQTNKTQHQVQVFENKQPVFENGFYRLNFHGRVSVPSVKNFQLVQTESLGPAAPLMTKTAAPTPSSLLVPALREDGPTVYLQFGKVDDNKFHLDFRSPITPIQAFAIALAQFSL